MATSKYIAVSAADSGYAALTTKVNNLAAIRHTWDFTLVTSAMSPYTVLAADQELVIDAPAANVALVLPAVADSDGRRVRISAHGLSGHTLTTTVADASNINGSASLSHSQYTSKELACLNGKWLAY
jgi:hypothetical protein